MFMMAALTRSSCV